MLSAHHLRAAETGEAAKALDFVVDRLVGFPIPVLSFSQSFVVATRYFAPFNATYVNGGNADYRPINLYWRAWMGGMSRPR
jgi:hypothetical protein